MSFRIMSCSVIKWVISNSKFCRNYLTHFLTFPSSHRITLHHITSYLVISYHIKSHHITSHHITSHHITFYHIQSYSIIINHILSSLILPSHPLPSSILPSPPLSYPPPPPLLRQERGRVNGKQRTQYQRVPILPHLLCAAAPQQQVHNLRSGNHPIDRPLKASSR